MKTLFINISSKLPFPQLVLSLVGSITQAVIMNLNTRMGLMTLSDWRRRWSIFDLAIDFVAVPQRVSDYFPDLFPLAWSNPESGRHWFQCDTATTTLPRLLSLHSRTALGQCEPDINHTNVNLLSSTINFSQCHYYCHCSTVRDLGGYG